MRSGSRGSNSTVECNLPKVEVAGSSPVSRSANSKLHVVTPSEATGQAATPQPALTFDSLWRSYRRALVARRRAPGTVARYEQSLRFWHDYCVSNGLPTAPAEWQRWHIEGWISSLIATKSPATCAGHYRALKTFLRWCVDEDELDVSPMQRMRCPTVPLVPPAVLSADIIGALLEAAKGRGIEARRDTAIILTLAATGMRRQELVGLRLQDVDLVQGIATVTGKTGTRCVPLTAAVCVAIDRYLRVRATHRRASLPNLLLGHFGPVTGGGVLQLLKRRAAMAGITERVWVHGFRHTATHNLLAAGLSELDTCSILGWASTSMLQRYGASQRSERALQSYRRLFG
jgi:integrase/recombinase XerC